LAAEHMFLNNTIRRCEVIEIAPIAMETPQRNAEERGVGMESGTEVDACLKTSLQINTLFLNS